MKPGDKFKPNDTEVTRLKGSGPGGQNRNKRETGIRLKHSPTGVVVSATERRSQAQNLSVAFERLDERLKQLSHKPKPRKKSKPKRSAQRRRLDKKRAHSEKKQFRSSRHSDD